MTIDYRLCLCVQTRSLVSLPSRVRLILVSLSCTWRMFFALGMVSSFECLVNVLAVFVKTVV